MQKHKNTRGFTLVEIAIVLVIIGLLLGGILKGQELINNAKVRAIADRQNSLKVAWFSFIDRYQGIPGDFPRAHNFIAGATSGNGDGIVGAASGLAATSDLAVESVGAMQHLTSAGYLRCGQCTTPQISSGTGPLTATPNASNSLTNAYGGTMVIHHTVEYFTALDPAAAAATATVPRLAILTGPQMPSNIIAEVDRKIDDGNPFTGDFVFSEASGAAASTHPTANDAATCAVIAASSHTWNNGQAAPVQPNCGAAVFI